MQEWSFDWWDVTCILGSMAVSLLLAFRLPEILAGISEIEESATTASIGDGEEGEGEEEEGGEGESHSNRCRQRRRSSQTDRARSGGEGKDDDVDKSRDSNNLCQDDGQHHHRVRSTSGSRSPARPRASTGSSVPSSTCSSPRHPASHVTRRSSGPRRSLSLPNGGLSYGADVKILYRDGHFVAVVDPQSSGCGQSTTAGGAASHSSTDLGRLGGEKEEGGPSPAVSPAPSTNSSPRRASTSSAPSPASVLASQILRTGSAASEAVKASMRAEILALLERGITDPKRILEEACLRSLELEPNATSDPPGPASSPGWESPEAPLFHSLPRRRHNARPVSVDESRLGRLYSKSQQSLVGRAEMDRRQGEEDEDDACDGYRDSSRDDPGWEDRMMNLAKERSMVKRNKSFNEAMGSRVDLTRVNRELRNCDGKGNNSTCAGGSPQKLANCEDETKSGKSRGQKGPGFIQRMLQKRRGSTQEKQPPVLAIGSASLLEASREDLTGSTVSLPQFGTSGRSGSQSNTATSTASTSPGKTAGRDRDASVGRKMSLRSLFRRKNSADMSAVAASGVGGGEGQGINENSGSPPIATFLNDDDIGALTNSPPTPSTMVHRRLPQRAENGEPYTVPHDACDPLSASYPSRSRAPRGGHPAPPSPGLHAVLGRSVSHEGGSSNDTRPEVEVGRDCSPRRARSSSGRGHTYQQQMTLSPVSPSSPPSLSLSSPLSSSSSSSRVRGHNSWSSSDLDPESSSEDTITSRSISPSGRTSTNNLLQLSPLATPIADHSFSSVSEGDETLVAGQDGLSPPVYRTFTSSPMGARRRLHRDLSPAEEEGEARPTRDSAPDGGPQENGAEPGLALDSAREITSSNSNDSGIQRDANVNSSAESIM
ncbi:hypothetical protein EGW08_008269, partial [Elysia chlorotica]